MQGINIIVIAHDIRSSHNIGALFRTCEALGVSELILSGYSPYPIHDKDTRLPHLANKISEQIHKTALGAEKLLTWQKIDDIESFISSKKKQGYKILALEQYSKSVSLNTLNPPKKVVLILGREVEGIDRSILKLASQVVEIPMIGKKESLNVVQAAAIAIYHLRYAGIKA
ncbi:MAG: TrmH family RNA methyltransferase [Patescibacteria group bacterium]